ncbi:MAG: DUF559 domain-containing protein [Gordonia sp. (in: high G+C Gram-positive bacteria)]
MDLNEFIVRHDAVLSTQQAQQFLSRSAVLRRINAQDWKRVAPRVYLVAGHPRSARAQARIAVLSVGDDAVLGGAAAAWWLGLHDKEPSRHLVFTGARGRHQRRSATARVRHRVLNPADVIEHGGLRVTAHELTVLEAAVDVGISVIDSALLRGSVSLDDLVSVHERYPGRIGVAAVSRFLHLLRDGARSEGERILAGLFVDARITGWTANHPASGYVIDFAFPELRLAVEMDGCGFHRDLVAFQHDRTRRNALVLDGWVVLNFTWADLLERPQHVVRQVRTVIDRLSMAAAS